MLKGRYTNYLHRLHYLRGALIALDWDTRLRLRSDGEASLMDAAPWIGRWDPDEPTVVVVETEEGERRCAFFARGGEKEIPAYVPAATPR